MKIKSKQTIFSILAGMIVGLLVFIFLRPTCWGPLVGVFVAAYFAKVSSPKEGAIIGAIVLIPIGMYGILQIPADETTNDTASTIGTIVGMLLGLGLLSGIGALYGMIIGKLFQMKKDKTIIF